MRKTYRLDPAHTRIGFAVRHMMVATVRGRFGEYDGQVTVEDDDPTTAVAEFTIKAHSVDTGQEMRDNHLRSPDFFHAEQFPELRFKSTSVERVEEGRYKVRGDLTIRDQTRPIELDVEVEGPITDPYGNERAGITAQTRINRKDWGLTYGAALETGGAIVADQVRLEIDAELVAVREPVAV